MTIDIEIKGPDAINEIYDLRNFIHEQEISDVQVQLKEQAPVEGTMSILAVAGLVAHVAGELAFKAGMEMALEKSGHSFSKVIKKWLKKRKDEGKPDIEVYTEQNDGSAVKSFVTDSNGQITQLNKLNFAIDVKNTKVLLIGNSEFDFNFPPIKPVKGNVEDFYQMLTDKKIIGIPPENITVALNKNSGEIEEQLLLLSNQPNVETMLIYYAGHGYKADAKKLFLVAKKSKKIGDHLISGIDFDFVKNVILKQSSAAQKIVILDACHSGIATQGEEDFLAGFNVKGTYIFTSSSGDEVSYFNTDKQHTFFTGEMINVLKNGLDNNHEQIALKDIYETVTHNLKEKNFPEPRYKSELNIPLSNFYIARNLKFSVENWKLKARQLMQDGRTDEALAEFNKLQEQYPDDESLRAEMEKGKQESQYLLLVGAADSFFEDQEYEKAIEHYEEALKIKQEFSVLSKKNKCKEYLEVKKRLLARTQGGGQQVVKEIIPPPEKKQELIKEEPIKEERKAKEEQPELIKEKALKENIQREHTVLNAPQEKKWYMAALIHLFVFGFGLFYSKPSANRKWLYPSCILLSAVILFLANNYESIGNDESNIFVVLFVGGLIGGYIVGLIDSVVSIAGGNTGKTVAADAGITTAKADTLNAAGKNVNNKGNNWMNILGVLWVLQYILILNSAYNIRYYLFDCDYCIPFIYLLGYYLNLFLTPVIIFLLFKKYKPGWILAMFMSVLKVATILVYVMGATFNSYNFRGSDNMAEMIITLAGHGLLLYILARPDIKTLFRVSNKLALSVLISSILISIAYCIAMQLR